MVAAKLLEPTPRGIAFAIILGVAVFVDDRFGGQRNHDLVIGMDKRRAEELMRIGHAAVAMLPLQT